MAGSVKQLILDIVARDQASATLRKVGDSAERTGKGFDALGKAALLIGGTAAITAFGITSVKAFAEAEAAQSQLQLAFSKFPALADTNIGRLQALNAAMQDKAAIDGDSLAAADAVLARFQLTGSEIEKLTPLLVDYVTYTGKEAPAAAETLGKALMGNARALKALGVEFTPTGDRAADLATIMGLLQEKVGGAGEAFQQTASGQIKSLGLAFEDVQEEVGGALVPAMSALVSVGKPIASAFGALPEPVKATAVAIGFLGAAATVAAPKLLALRTAVAEAGGMGAVMQASGARLLAALTNPWTAGIAVVAGALGIWAQYQAEAKARVDELTTAFQQQGQAGQQAAAQILATNLAPYSDLLKQLGSNVTEATVAMLRGGDAARVYAAGLQDKAIAATDMASGDRTLIQATDELIGKVKAEGDAVDESRAAADAAAGAKRAAADATAAVAEQASASEKAARAEADALDAVATAFKRLNGLMDDQATRDNFLSSLNDLEAALKKNGSAFKGASEAALDNRAALRDAVGAAIDVADTYKSSASKMAVFNSRLKQIKADMVASGISPAEADRLLAPYRAEFAQSIAYVRGQAGAAGAAGQAVGAAMGAGMEAGVRSRAQSLANIAAATVAGAIAAAKKAAMISSPSRLTQYIGEMIAQGLIVGLTDKTDDTKEAASKWIDGLKQRIEARMEQLKDKLDKAKDDLKSLREEYWSTLESIQGDMKEFGALTGFDLGAARSTSAAATSALANEDQKRAAVNDLEQQVLLAATEEERIAIAERLAKAQEELAEATRARMEAETARDDAAVTGDNLRKSMAARLQKMKDFAAALKQLKSLGLNGAMIQELLDAGPVDGLEMAKAILDAGLDTITGLNVAQADLDTVSRDIGRFGANLAMPEFAAQVTTLQGQIATLQRDYTELARIQKVVAELHIDGRKLVETLIRYRNEHPGAEMP